MASKNILGLSLKVFLTILWFFISFVISAMLTQGDAASATSSSSAEASPAPSDESMQAAMYLLIIALGNAAILSWYLQQTKMRTWALTLAIFSLVFGVYTLLPQMDSWIFQSALSFPKGALLSIVQMGFLNALLLACVLPLIWRRPKTQQVEKTNLFSGFRNWKIWTSLSLTYLLIYLLFGYFVAWQSPALRTFYQDSDSLLPFFEHMAYLFRHELFLILFQIFRGLIWTFFSLLIVYTIRGKWFEKGLLTALFFAMPALFLLLPNPYMTAEVRWVHLLETFSSNFVFGALAVTGIWYLSDYNKIKA